MEDFKMDNEAHSAPRPVTPARENRNVTAILLMIFIGLNFLLAHSFYTKLKVRGELAKLFWKIEDTREVSQDLFESGYYMSLPERRLRQKELGIELAQLRNIKDEIAELQAKYHLRRDARLYQIKNMYFITNTLVRQYASLLGPREAPVMHLIKDNESDMMREYFDYRGALASALGIPRE